MGKFENKEHRLSMNEANYWKRIFVNNLKVGVEVESCFNNSRNNNTIIQEGRAYFQPSGDYGKFGKFGIVQVKGDGSLDNGAEFCTIGRRISFIDSYYQFKFLCDWMIGKGAYNSPKAGLHNHIMLDYGGYWNCEEKPVPDIILKNFVQLCKGHAPELVFMTSTYNERGSITRIGTYCMHDLLMKTNFMNKNAFEIKNAIYSQGSRYQFLNFAKLGVSADQDRINIFHMEMRFPDGSLYPAQIAAQGVLYAAMMVKAVKLSMNGVMGVSGETWGETKELMNNLRQSGGGSCASRPPTNEMIAKLKERGLAFIDYMKPELDIFDTHAYMILRLLAETPVSLMLRVEGASTETINRDFEQLVNIMYMEDMEDCMPLIEVLLSQNITKHRFDSTWKEEAAKTINTSLSDIDTKLIKINRKMPVRFDKTLGTFVIV